MYQGLNILAVVDSAEPGNEGQEIGQCSKYSLLARLNYSEKSPYILSLGDLLFKAKRSVALEIDESVVRVDADSPSLHYSADADSATATLALRRGEL